MKQTQSRYKHLCRIVLCDVSITQAGQRHGRQVDRVHWVRPLVQRPHKLKVEDAADQTADTASRKQDHLKDTMVYVDSKKQN